jgi:hypothetical protein
MSDLTLRQVWHAAANMGEAADSLCRRLPSHPLHMPLRDLSFAIANAMTALSDKGREIIANG